MHPAEKRRWPPFHVVTGGRCQRFEAVEDGVDGNVSLKARQAGAETHPHLLCDAATRKLAFPMQTLLG